MSIPSSAEPVLIEKNRRERLRLSIEEFKGRTLLNCRVWYLPGEGEELKPGRDGWAIAVERLPEIIAGLQRLEQEARTVGASIMKPDLDEVIRLIAEEVLRPRVLSGTIERIELPDGTVTWRRKIKPAPSPGGAT